jgi:hypothetical protein
LNVPEDELERTRYSKEMYHHKMVDLVRSLVPAYTDYRINLGFTVR